MPVIRRGGAGDLAAVAAIQDACPEAAHWKVTDYLDHDFLVATVGDATVGFAIFRDTGPGEREILNLAVAPDFRRQGVARELVDAVFEGFAGCVFLEVRESNQIAREFYNSMGFQVLSRRQNYYDSPPEAAIVMKFHSC